MTEGYVPSLGPGRFQLNVRKARRDGYIIIRAHLCCGCCTVDMAFLNLHNAEVQFGVPAVSDTIRDDMGNVWYCVNSGKGFKYLKSRGIEPHTD